MNSPARLLAEADQLISERAALWSHIRRRVPAGEDAVHPLRTRGHIRGGSSPTDLDHAAATRAELAASLRAIRDRLIDGRKLSREPLDEIIDALLDLATRHADSLPALAFARGTDDAGCEHAIATAALTVAAAIELVWSRSDIREAAMVALLVDLSLGTFPFDPNQLARPLTEIEQSRMLSHGDLSALLASRIDAVPQRVLLAISQHHERPDGRGTPRGVKSPALHDFALLVGPCDTLAALAAPRAHRPALPPHAALMRTAELAREGVLDESMTNALIRACGVFPPGSHVRLSTGDIAIVLARPARSDSRRPVVRIMPDWGAASFAALGRPVTIDLADDHLANVSVVAEVDAASEHA
jgi:HD-GYP domain-containing protein (c-di-GMP phosphodiesterase class II)